MQTFLSRTFLMCLMAMVMLPASEAFAATLFISPASGEYKVGQTFDVVVRVDSTDQGFNAAQATLKFSKDSLEVISLDSSPKATAFNFWLQQPKFSNEDGTVSFIGGTTNGVLGAAVPALTVTFRAKGAGSVSVVPSDSAVTASDGSGTNILSDIHIGQYTIQPSSGTAAAPVPGVSSVPTIPVPVQITRTPTPAHTVPTKGPLTVALYPDETQWYNVTTNFLVSWKLPPDVTGVGTSFNRQSIVTPGAASEGLFESKTFSAPGEGVSYVHVRFQNALGWGTVMNYRIAVDTVPPLPFTVSALEGTTTGNPTPTLQYRASDGLSGIDHYVIRVDVATLPPVQNNSLTLTPLPPGPHTIAVQAVDKAGNSRESSMVLTVLPIVAPTIAVAGGDVFLGEGNGNLSVSGTSLPNTTILLALKDASGVVIEQSTVPVDGKGNWETVLSGLFKQGTYVAEATARDARGAQSFPVRSQTIAIRYRPLFTLGGIEVSETGFFLGIVVLLLAGFAAGWFSYRLWREQVGRKVIIAQRDVVNAFAMIGKDIDTMLKSYTDAHVNTESRTAEMEFILKKMKTNLEKTERYVVDNINEINE